MQYGVYERSKLLIFRRELYRGAGLLVHCSGLRYLIKGNARGKDRPILLKKTVAILPTKERE